MLTTLAYCAGGLHFVNTKSEVVLITRFHCLWLLLEWVPLSVLLFLSHRVTYYAEFLPRRARGVCITFLEASCHFEIEHIIMLPIFATVLMYMYVSVSRLWYPVSVSIALCTQFSCNLVSRECSERVLGFRIDSIIKLRMYIF